MQKVAIMIDGGFFVKRLYSELGNIDAEFAAKFLIKYCHLHLQCKNPKEERKTLHRIFYYDCLPSEKKVYNPITKRTDDLKKSDLNNWMNTFINELKVQRKVALRLGRLADDKAGYYIPTDITKSLLNGKIDALTTEHLRLNVIQKGVDIKLGIDIATLALRNLVDQIVLISGDSDFVPAAKLARREGIDFILDPLWANISPDLTEHIDGLQSFNMEKVKNKILNITSDSH